MAYYLLNFTKKAAAKGVPLHEQAAKLLTTKLWGVGPKAPNRDVLAPGDRVLAYVGAPENLFIGRITLSKGYHEWTPEEATVYAKEAAGGGFPAGLTFGDTELWDKPVPINSVWSSMPASETNPNHLFYGGVVRIKQEDFEIVIKAAGGTAAPPTANKPTPQPAESTMADLLFAETEKLKKYLETSPGKSLSEAATRAMFIDGYIKALGYTGFDDVDYAVKVGPDEADYVMHAGGKEAIVLEAKKLGTPLGAKHAEQVIKYASVLGVTRWGLVTDGRVAKLYDRKPDLPAEQRLVFKVDLADYEDREDFDVRVYPDLALMSKKAMEEGTGLAQRAAQQAISDLLTTGGSDTTKALAKELADSGLAQMSAGEVAEMLSEILG